MKVSAIIPTRGDVDMRPVLASLPVEWEVIVWDNSGALFHYWPNGARSVHLNVGALDLGLRPAPELVPNLGPHARFAAIAYATGDVIYVQDDDVIVSDPQAIVTALVTRQCPECDALDHQEMTDGSWICHTCGCVEQLPESIVCNVPEAFRVHYPDSGIVGFGAAFHRDVPELAFARFFARHPAMQRDDPLFLRESCRVVTTLTPRVLVDVEKVDREFASNPDRLWKQPDHFWAAQRMINLARMAR